MQPKNVACPPSPSSSEEQEGTTEPAKKAARKEQNQPPVRGMIPPPPPPAPTPQTIWERMRIQREDMCRTTNGGNLNYQNPLTTLPSQTTQLHNFCTGARTTRSRTTDLTTYQTIAYDRFGRVLPPSLLQRLTSIQPVDLDACADDINHIFTPMHSPCHPPGIQPRYLTIAQDTHDHMISALQDSQGFLMHPNYNNDRSAQQTDKLPTLTSWAAQLRTALEHFHKTGQKKQGWFVYPASDPSLPAALHLLCDHRAVTQHLLPFVTHTLIFRNVHFLAPSPSPTNPFGLQEIKLPFAKPIVALLLNTETKWGEHIHFEDVNLAPPSVLSRVMEEHRLTPPPTTTLCLDLDTDFLETSSPISFTDLRKILQHFYDNQTDTESVSSSVLPISLMASAQHTFSPLPKWQRVSLSLSPPMAQAILSSLSDPHNAPLHAHILGTTFDKLLEDDQYYVSLTPEGKRNQTLQEVLSTLRCLTSPAAFTDLFPRTSTSAFLRIRQTEDAEGDFLREISRFLFQRCHLNLFHASTRKLVRFSNTTLPLNLPPQSLIYRDPSLPVPADPTATIIQCPRFTPHTTLKLTAALFGEYASLQPISRDDPFNISHATYSLVYKHTASTDLAHHQIVDGLQFSAATPQPTRTQQLLQAAFDSFNPTVDQRIQYCTAHCNTSNALRTISNKDMGIRTDTTRSAPPPPILSDLPKMENPGPGPLHQLLQPIFPDTDLLPFTLKTSKTQLRDRKQLPKAPGLGQLHAVYATHSLTLNVRPEGSASTSTDPPSLTVIPLTLTPLPPHFLQQPLFLSNLPPALDSSAFIYRISST